TDSSAGAAPAQNGRLLEGSADTLVEASFGERERQVAQHGALATARFAEQHQALLVGDGIGDEPWAEERHLVDLAHVLAKGVEVEVRQTLFDSVAYAHIVGADPPCPASPFRVHLVSPSCARRAWAVGEG